MLQFHDWLVFGLSGALVSEPSSAAMSQLVDVRARSWADELLKAVGLDRDLFPDMADPASVPAGCFPRLRVRRACSPARLFMSEVVTVTFQHWEPEVRVPVMFQSSADLQPQ